MQIKAVVLWPIDRRIEPRRLDFQEGRVNVIVGAPKTGKSTVWPIIDYCLGSSESRIPIGVTRDQVAWYGVLFATLDGDVLVARPNPSLNMRSKAAFYHAPQGKIPDYPDANIALEELKAKLSTPLIRFPKTPLGWITIRELLKLSFAPHYILANPSMLSFDDSPEVSSQKMRFVLPKILQEDDSSSLSNLRSARNTVLREGLEIRRSVNKLTVRMRELYTSARLAGFCGGRLELEENPGPQRLRFELAHVLAEQFGQAFRSTAIEFKNDADKLERVATAGRIKTFSPEQAFLLGRLSECLEMGYLIDELRSKRDQWRDLNREVEQLQQDGARHYKTLSEGVSRFAKLLKLDFADEQIVVEEQSMTIKFLFRDGRPEERLARIGGKRNVAGYNLAVLLAIQERLQAQFGDEIPRFLFLDDLVSALSDSSDEDQNVNSVLSALASICERSSGRLQIVVFAGSALGNEKVLGDSVPFNFAHVAGTWTAGNGLVPASWEKN